MNKFKNSTEAIKNHLENGTITQKQCSEFYGATRLGAIIFNLRQQGNIIKTHIRKGTTRFGRPCEYAEYELLEKA
tara:strand:- start:1 stop:225 length:225 start_codon:yes stop_codon:yes gene_type:complete